MERRVIELSHKHNLSHIGSCLTALPILDHIYKTKEPNDVVVLSSGHAGLALYVVLEQYEGRDAEKLLKKHGIHPCRDVENGIFVSSGSLGQGITVAVGYALGGRTVHCVISDGECAEGAVWEALAFIHKKNLKNIKVHVNINGFSAYDAVSKWNLWWRLKAFWWPVKIWFTQSPYFTGLEAHYKTLKEEDIEIINAQGLCKVASRGYGGRLADIFANSGSWLWNFGRYSP